MNDTIIIYHDNCIDGFTAAWVCWKKFGYEATYIGAKYGDAPPDVSGKDVYIVDFSYPRGVLIKMEKQAKSLLVLDHHTSAEGSLRGLGFCVFDMERSGAGLAWDYFFPEEERPWLVDYVEDRDLWKWKWPSSKAVSAFIATHNQTFDIWEKLASGTVQDAWNLGSVVLSYIDRYVREMKEHARIIEFEGYMVPIVNAPYINISELVGSMAETSCAFHRRNTEFDTADVCENCHGTGSAPFAIGWFQRGDGLYAYSLRSRGDFDVSELAKRYGGGGHKNAAGFVRGERIRG
jgi:oligoribonuclease NrnB/cAMP/cGMP phosphodiesterase (DHH superfamily)